LGREAFAEAHAELPWAAHAGENEIPKSLSNHINYNNNCCSYKHNFIFNA